MSIPAHSKSNRPARSAGFTLIELMITITIGAILMAIGIPSFRDFILGQRVKTASYDMSYTLTFARSEAIKRNDNVVVRPTTTGSWENGWSVQTTISGTTTTLSQQTAYSGLTISGPDLVTYTSSGRLAAATSSFQVTGNTHVRCININLSGLPTGKTGSC
jgi:type IV fimbrial biogenesis protein FimT